MQNIMRQPRLPELRFLLACARAHTTAGDEKAIRQLLDEGVDWTLFVQKAIDHGLAGLAGYTLARLVPDLVPHEVLEGFQAFIVQTRISNQARLDELVRLVEGLAAAGVKTIPFKGPVLAQQAFGDLGLRGFRDLDFLIRDADVAQTIKMLTDGGYNRDGKLTDRQFAVIHRLQGQEILFHPGKGAVEPHTRLTFLKMALDIDYQGIWRRARPDNIFGHTMLTFAPEDTMIVLALHGGKELWWDIKWACDVADFIASHPALDWAEIAARARAQGCYRMLLVATALARSCLRARIPDFLIAAEKRDPRVGEILDRILARWEAEDPGGPPSNKTLSMDRLRLHDGFVRQASYVLRTLFLPGPQHIRLAALPRFLEFAYIPIGLAHDLIALPLYRLWQASKSWAGQARKALALSPLALTLASADRRERLNYFQKSYRAAAKALAANPQDAFTWTRMGDALAGLGFPAEAVACYDKSLAIIPDNDGSWKQRGKALAALAAPSQPRDGIPEIDSRSPDGLTILAGFLLSQRRYQDASKASQKALQLAPRHPAATRIGLKARLYACDWRQREQDKEVAAASLAAGELVIRPVNLKQLTDSEELSLALARLLAEKTPPAGKPLWRGEQYRHDKIRIAYLSTDFRNHAVGWTIAPPLEHHDKSRFEITAVSTGPDDGSPIRKRIQAAADRFFNANAMSQESIAKAMRDWEIDIAIDLNGLTGNDRGSVLAHRPAPLQVNYLGYPGTMGVPFIDYLIADPIVVPEENRAFYSEKIAYLPNSYLPCDSRRLVPGRLPSRTQQGLPEAGFVFASFNNLHKLGPEIFSIWMRLLRAMENSVLWLPAAQGTVRKNLGREAQTHGVAPERLIFARFEERPEDHLARQCLADLFLDILPYNAHSTAGDALLAGLPLLTCLGRSFQGRVAASLLQAAGMPELITSSLDEYERRALELARDPGQLAVLRQKLADRRATAPLFDTARFTRDLERVYTTMWQRQQAGKPPADFSIADRE